VPTKKTIAESGSDELEKPKPKRKVVRKVKKAEPDLSSLPNNAGPVGMDSVARPVAASHLHNKHTQPVTPVEVDQHEVMRDIKPREHHRDATFLVPEKFGFDLKTEHKARRAARTRFVKIMAYGLTILILLLVGALFYLNSYSSKIADQDTDIVTDTTDTTDVAPVAYSVNFANVPADLKPVLTDLLQKKFGTEPGFADYTNALPEVKVDTLFVKDSADQKNTDLITELATYGIKPEVQQVDTLQAGSVLYLTTLLAKPDLSGMTSAVYNATGVSGLAKTNCDILLGYKATACQALNATSSQTGTTVAYKNVKALFNLKRSTQYQAAKFSAAPLEQVEDIRLTVGK
jgi:hypothetical protein